MIYGLEKSKVDSTLTGGRMMDQTSGIPSPPQKKATTLHVLFFCGGFPDHWTTFQPLAQRISATQVSTGSDDERIICGVTCLPGYDTHHNNFKIEGYTFDEMAVSLQSACKILLSTITERYSSQKILY